MHDPKQGADPQLSSAQADLLRGFEAEAAEVFPQLGAAAAGDDALIAQLASGAIATAAAAPAAGQGAGGAGVGAKVVGALGVVALTGVIVAAIVGGEDEPEATAEVTAEVAAVEPVVSAEPQLAPALVPSPAPEPEVEGAETGAPEIEAGEESEVAEAEPKPESRPTRSAESPPSPEPQPTLTARDLLKAANAARRTGDYAKAAAGYARLVREYSDSREAMIGRVSLGKLQLERLGDPAEALRSFDAYLAANPRGNLAEEALYGRARSLRRLGLAAKEREAWSQLLERFPDTVHADEARGHLGGDD